MEPAPLDGLWRVRRCTGLLPPGRIGKYVAGDRGHTRWLGMRFAFEVRALPGDCLELRYRWFPVRDELRRAPPGWSGAGRVLGMRFCTFALEREGVLPLDSARARIRFD